MVFIVAVVTPCRRVVLFVPSAALRCDVCLEEFNSEDEFGRHKQSIGESGIEVH